MRASSDPTSTRFHECSWMPVILQRSNTLYPNSKPKPRVGFVLKAALETLTVLELCSTAYAASTYMHQVRTTANRSSRRNASSCFGNVSSHAHASRRQRDRGAKAGFHN